MMNSAEANFRYAGIFAIIEKIRYVAKILFVAKFSALAVWCINDFVLVNFVSTLNVIILFRIDWYFHLVVRLYKPFSEHFVT